MDYILLAKITIGAASAALLSLLLLHFLSREFHPSWRMISEYAYGKHKWLLTLFFSTWALAVFAASALLWGRVDSGWYTFGVVLLIVSGIGTFMGGMFDVKHKLHGAAAAIGIPPLPAAALIISYHLAGNPGWEQFRTLILTAAHSTWISVAVMGVSMAMFMSAFKKAGLPMGPNVAPPEKLPDGVYAWNGYANRILVLCFIYWLIATAITYLQLY